MSVRNGWTGGVARLVLAGLVAVGVAACDDESEPTGPTQDLVELASSNADLEALTAAVGAAGLADDLQAAGPFTVFAPTDAAFDAVPSGVVSSLLESGNVDVLQELLLGHVVQGAVRASDLSDGQVITTLSGDELTVTIQNGEVRIGGARVQAADVEATNGVVHVIDGVLTQGLNIVQRARVTPELSSLVEAVTAAGLGSALSDESAQLTVFAPVNAAFDAIAPVPTDPATLQPILLYHVVGSEAYSTDLSDGQMLTTLQSGMLTVQLDTGVTIEGAQNAADVAVPDVTASNGVIHVIDAVLLPPSS